MRPEEKVSVFLCFQVKVLPWSLYQRAVPQIKNSTCPLRIARCWHSGYSMARMPYDLILAPEAVEDFQHLTARLLAVVREAIETYLRREPMRESRSRIKKLRGTSHPEYRLRVDEIRIFYDILGNAVEILAIVPRSQAAAWLKGIGEQD